jgi:hypothetical protein
MRASLFPPLCAAAAVAMLASRGGGGGSEPVAPSPTAISAGGASTAPVSGSGGIGVGGALGQFRNATVVVSRAEGTLLGQTTTGPDGMITATLCGEPGPLLVEIRGGPGAEYLDEGVQAYLPFPQGAALRAYVPAVARNIGVTPFTDAAYAIAVAQVPSATGPGPATLRARPRPSRSARPTSRSARRSIAT